MAFEPIAIVGQSCVLPGALSPEEFWDAVASGQDLISDVDADRWRMSQQNALGTPSEHADRTWSNRGGYVRGFDDVFNPEGFLVPAEEIETLDPLFKWVLHTTRTALEDAGIEDRSRAGLILGNLSFPSSGLSRFAEHTWLGPELAAAAKLPPAEPRDRFMSGLPALLAARALGLGDVSYALDAACASSLYAIKLACDRLADGHADVMLAGAVNRADDLFLHVGFCALKALSATGQSRPFHAEADGLVPGDGAAIVVLKRLADARKAGDKILGVIRGVGLSNDGRGMGFLAPSVDGQQRAMERAYEIAGLKPSDISLIECHATGTTVGDKTEIESTGRLFAGLSGVPIGSLKSNTGHLITAAGVAGLMKVLGAFKAKLLPPSLHAEDQNQALENSPFRVLTQAEPWNCDGIRRAAVSAFGFGGNNAHLIVEEPSEKSVDAVVSPALDAGPVAIVGIGVAGGGANTAAEFSEKLLNNASSSAFELDEIALPFAGLRFPPNDLRQAIGQQLLLLRSATEALSHHEFNLEHERTGAFVGMGCDPEVARYGARWRLADWANTWGVESSRWVSAARDAFVSLLEAPGVLGTMPNIVANRLNSQHDLGGQGFTVSAEELSGVHALSLASRALRHGELDVALVGAVDLSCEPVHEAALQALGMDAGTGDGAVTLVLQRLKDAEENNIPVLAVLTPDAESKHEIQDEYIEKTMGRVHAAHGLFKIAAGAVSCARRKLPGGKSMKKDVSVNVSVTDMTGQTAQVVLSSHGNNAVAIAPYMPDGSVLAFSAHPPTVRLPELPTVGESNMDFSVGLLAPEPDPRRTYTMAPAPYLPPVVEVVPEPPAPAPVTRTVPITPPVASSSLAQPAVHAASANAAAISAPEASASPPVNQVMARVQAHQAQLSAIHQQFLAQQALVQEQYLALRQTALDGLLRGYQQVQTGVPASPLPAASLDAPQLPVQPIPVVSPQTESVPTAARPITPQPEISRDTVKARVKPVEPWLDRAQVEIHASGKISEIYGELFQRQDGYLRQVRMPEPPLLLADRVMSIDAEPGSMGTGSIQTETDVRWDSWYLHDGRMPAGIMIESGQADLMLISYLGIDFLNQSDRVYRLLGCELTYHGSLPKPGDTLEYDIVVDGHAAQGDIRLFFFHYDCLVDGQPKLTVRQGQAGFFSDEELADSDGVLWSPETGECAPNPRLSKPAVECGRTQFDRPKLEAFARGDLGLCFGDDFSAAYTHTRTPRIAGGRMLFMDEITHFDTSGGPWGRGYLRAVDEINSDDWFFDGHFKNDPCMPGTLMFEGCLQTMAFYLAAHGYTLDKDGWRFEPVPDESYKLRCRGQVTPTSKELIYELFVDEIVDGPYPTLYADLLCTVDGRKAFHCRRMGLRLVPGWPMDSRPELLADYVEPKPVAEAKGFAFDYASLLACAWGKPSKAFGPMYEMFDDTRKVARLPGPPYHFMSRVSSINGDIGVMKPGAVIEIEYDIPPDAWYFRENGCATMPFCVLLEAALQPCGWLASFVGSATTEDIDLFFRNLDGTGTLKTELLPTSGTLVTRVKITNVSKTGGMIIEGFEVECLIGDVVVYEMKTVFGFFPKEALAKQVGLGTTEEQRSILTRESDVSIDLTEAPERYFDGALYLPTPFLLMIDRVTGYWPEGGPAGLGAYRAEKDVNPKEWFFKAHFHQDPVQPGSLGIEAMIQLLQFAMIDKGMADGIDQPRFEPLMLNEAMTWKYRGQVRLHNKTISSTIEITDTGHDDNGVYAMCDASLWVDGMRIYEASNLGMRIVSGVAEPVDVAIEIDPAEDTWVNDHCPTWTVPALPLMSMLDQIATHGTREGRVLVGLENVKVQRWLAINGPKTIRNTIDGSDELLRVQLHDDDGSFASGTVKLATNYIAGPAPWAPLDAELCDNPYETGALFHGPAFQVLKSLRMNGDGASGLLDAGAGDVPLGALNQVLLDGATHCIPHDQLSRWCDAIDDDHVAYPAFITEMGIYGPTPTDGMVRCEVRFDGFFGGPRFPAFRVQLIIGESVWADFRLVEALFPKGPIGRAEPLNRRRFLKDRQYVEDVALSTDDGTVTRLDINDVKNSDWLAGTIGALYGSELPEDIARKEYIGRRVGVHPGVVPACLPVNRFDLESTQDGDIVTVGAGASECHDLSRVAPFWSNWLGMEQSPLQDLFYGLFDRFVRRVIIEDPVAYDDLTGKSVLYLANHQVGLESVLHSMLASGLSGCLTMALAKAEHQDSWIGQLLSRCFSYPGVNDPGLLQFFDRNDPAALPNLVSELSARAQQEQRSLLVHVEGTRRVQANQQVERMALVFTDMAIAGNMSIVPTRFVGGLPKEAASRRLEFPVGMGTQDYWLGRPITPDELKRLSPVERKNRVMDAINQLGPVQESPHLPDEAFESRVRALMAERGISETQATLVQVLLERAELSKESNDLLRMVVDGKALQSKGAKKKWISAFADWLTAKQEG